MVWQTSVSHTEIIQQTSNWVGTTFRETIEENGRGTEVEGVVTEYRENTALAMHLCGKFHVADIAWRIEEADRHTRLTVQADVRFKSLVRLMSIVFHPAFRKSILAQLRKEFATLKELCERDNGGSSACERISQSESP
jgi:hypothetical protein